MHHFLPNSNNSGNYALTQHPSPTTQPRIPTPNRNFNQRHPYRRMQHLRDLIQRLESQNLPDSLYFEDRRIPITMDQYIQFIRNNHSSQPKIQTLNQEKIKNLNIKINETEPLTCPVCIEEKHIVYEFECKHYICFDCIEENYSQIKSECPMCRKII